MGKNVIKCKICGPPVGTYFPHTSLSSLGPSRVPREARCPLAEELAAQRLWTLASRKWSGQCPSRTQRAMGPHCLCKHFPAAPGLKTPCADLYLPLRIQGTVRRPASSNCPTRPFRGRERGGSVLEKHRSGCPRLGHECAGQLILQKGHMGDIPGSYTYGCESVHTAAFPEETNSFHRAMGWYLGASCQSLFSRCRLPSHAEPTGAWAPAVLWGISLREEGPEKEHICLLGCPTEQSANRLREVRQMAQLYAVFALGVISSISLCVWVVS